MKTRTVVKIAIASMLCAQSCSNERGVVVYKQDLPEEKALYVNIIGDDKFASDTCGTFCADRKLFFADSCHIEPFIYSTPGDTICFRNPSHSRFVEMNKKNRVVKVGNIPERLITKCVREFMQNEK